MYDGQLFWVLDYYYTHALMNFLSIAKKMMAGSQLTSFFLIFNNEKVILRS